jgi:membrane protease YdiL (CAAX protease family)
LAFCFDPKSEIGRVVKEILMVFVKKHPALSLFVLSFLLGVLPLALVAAGLLPLGFSQLGALSASIAGVILAGVEGGRARVVELLRRGLIWRVELRWWATAILYMAPLAAVALYINATLGNTAFDWGALRPIYQILPMMLVLIILAGLGEEFGWRGFLLPRLQRHHNALISSLIIGVFHSLWHVPLFLVAGTAQSDWAQQIGLLPAFLGYSTFVIAWAIQLTWFFNNTRGSVLIVAVVHGAGNAWIGGYFDISGNAGIAGNNILTGLMVILSLAIVAIAGQGHFSRVTERNTLSIN